MSLETSVEGSPEWISRIAHSASGLARNLVSNGIGFESTGELAALRSAQKIAYQSHSHDALLSTADRLPRLLSNRYRANATFRSSERSPEALSDAELEDEIAEFLQKKCAINGESSAESSRSASPQYGGKERNDSVMAGSSKTQLSELDNDHSGFLKGYSYATDEKDEQWFSSPKMGKVPVVNETLASLTNQNYPQKQWSKAVRQSVTNTLAERELAHFDTHEYIPRTNLDDETVSASRQQQREHLKQQAAQRLLLISKHLDIPKMLNPPPTSSSFSGQASDTARTACSAASIFESSYNQLCYSDDSTAQEWAAYQAEGSFCLQQDLLVQQQRLDAYGATVMQQVTHQAHEAQQQSHMSTSAIEKDFPEKSTPLEPKETTTHAPPTRSKGHEQEKQEGEKIDFTFHCPWVQCHEHLRSGTQYIQSSASGGPEGLACVHVGCSCAFVEEAEWREHVRGAHHGILATPPPQNMSEGEAATAATETEAAAAAAESGSGEDDGAFERAWRIRHGVQKRTDGSF